MDKKDYVDLCTEKPWKEMEDHFHKLPAVKVEPIKQISIDTEEWIQFTMDQFDLAQQKWECPKPHYTDDSNRWAGINNRLGRNRDNTFELNYGMIGDTNEKLKKLLGYENIDRLEMDPDSVLMRLIVKLPGHGIAWHKDDASSYAKKFGDADLTQLKRLWFSIDDWKDGHAFQISKTVLTHWKKGSVYEIPFGVGHASSNFGYCPQYTVSFTGITK
jgi:hypothetical protein